YGCHDHLPAEVEAFHAKEGIDQLEPCGECHPTGQEGEAGEAGHGA
ncbi:MAG: class III cytochrome C family protein, partial [Anaerolineae bacterium]|nr:class III cytochrome C family protein [Anaerolineae bacterium]